MFFAALTAEIRTLTAAGASTVDIGLWGKASKAAVETLSQSVTARVSHRTFMDVLIPFVEVLASRAGLHVAIGSCRNGDDGTARCEA
jgi:dihydroxyacetone kinase